MSEPIPESIPTSADPRSHRPIKRQRQSHFSDIKSQASEIEYLMSDPTLPLPLLSSSSSKKQLPPPPELVANVQGSSAGAGSGEFHVYKASRRREYERLKLMEEEAREEDEEIKWNRLQEERRRGDEEAVRKRREHRSRRRNRKKGKGTGEGGTGDGDGRDENKGNGDGSVVGKKKGSAEVGEEKGEKKGSVVPRHQRNGGSDHDSDAETNDMGVAKVLEENGIIIHDDD